MQFVEITPETVQNQSRVVSVMAGHAVSALPQGVETWRGRDWLCENAREILIEEMDLALDSAALARFVEACPVSGAAPRDYRPRILTTRDHLNLLVGIGFRNLQVDQPFVDVIAASRNCRDAQEMREVADALAQAFSVFAPRMVRMPRSMMAVEAIGSAVEGKITMAGRSSAMAACPRRLPPQLRLAATRARRIYDWYCGAYDRFAHRQPDLVPHVRREEEADLFAAEEAGALFEIMDGDRHAGLIAAYEGGEGPIKGLCIIEFMLDEPYRGRSLAVGAQAEFARLINAAGERIIFGTIHPRNQAALAVAERLGRKAIAQQMWIPLT